MHRRLAPAVLAVILVLQLGVSFPALAGVPTDQIRAHVDGVYQATGGQPSGRSGRSPERVPEATKIMGQMFDWAEMAKNALGSHWADLREAERAEFVQLFSALVERAYVSQIHLVDADRFQYLGDTVRGNTALVRTKVFTKHDAEIPVDYRARLQDGTRWKVYDVDVDGVSLVDNYRRQFNSIITRSSYEKLISQLKQKVNQG
jgi:phospholipid transport system substrate-binding protein